MNRSNELHDPLGNRIELPAKFLDTTGILYKDVSAVIGAPTFLIRKKNNRLYFFRLINESTNLMIEVLLKKQGFVVNACIKNPNADYISALLRNGKLMSFQ